MPKTTQASDAIPWEDFRGNRWEFVRWCKQDDPNGEGRAAALLHQKFAGNSQWAADFLGFKRGESVADLWKQYGYATLGREAQRRTSLGTERFDDDEPAEVLVAKLREYSLRKVYAHLNEWVVPAGYDEAWLVPICDIQGGHRLSAIDRLCALCEWIEATPNCMWFGGGDWYDFVCSTGKQKKGNEIMGPRGTRKVLKHIFWPIRKKCIGLGTGNHELQIERATQVEWDPCHDLAEDLEVPFLGYAFHIVHKIRAEDSKHIEWYYHYHSHGKGGAATASGRTNALLQIAATTTAELVSCGHLHDEISRTIIQRGVDPKTLEIVDHKRLAVMTPSFQKYGDFAERMALPPAPLGSISIRLGVDRHSLHVRQ